MAITTGVVADLLDPAGLADFALAPKGRSPALGNGAQHLLLLVGDVMGGAERLPLRPHDVSYLKLGALPIGSCAGRCRG